MPETHLSRLSVLAALGLVTLSAEANDIRPGPAGTVVPGDAYVGVPRTEVLFVGSPGADFGPLPTLLDADDTALEVTGQRYTNGWVLFPTLPLDAGGRYHLSVSDAYFWVGEREPEPFGELAMPTAVLHRGEVEVEGDVPEGEGWGEVSLHAPGCDVTLVAFAYGTGYFERVDEPCIVDAARHDDELEVSVRERTFGLPPSAWRSSLVPVERSGCSTVPGAPAALPLLTLALIRRRRTL